MNCVKCEIARAKVRTALMLWEGKNMFEVALQLTNDYGVEYYVDVVELESIIFRKNKVPPHTPYKIYGRSFK